MRERPPALSPSISCPAGCAGAEKGSSPQPRLLDTDFRRLPGPRGLKPAHTPRVVKQGRGAQGWMGGVTGRRLPHRWSEMSNGAVLSVSWGGCGFGHVGGRGPNQDSAPAKAGPGRISLLPSSTVHGMLHIPAADKRRLEGDKRRGP